MKKQTSINLNDVVTETDGENQQDGTVTPPVVEDPSPGTGETPSGGKRRPGEAFQMELDGYRAGLRNCMERQTLVDLLTPLGYGVEKLGEGMGKVDAVWASNLEQKSRRAAYSGCVRDQETKREAAQEFYKLIHTASKVVFRDDLETLQRMGLTGPRLKTFSGWRGQVDQCYHVLRTSEAVRTALGGAAVTAEFIASADQALTVTVDAHDLKMAKNAEAQSETERKTALLKDLRSWMKKFYKILDVACADDPQLKESAGLVVRTK